MKGWAPPSWCLWGRSSSSPGSAPLAPQHRATEKKYKGFHSISVHVSKQPLYGSSHRNTCWHGMFDRSNFWTFERRETNRLVRTSGKFECLLWSSCFCRLSNSWQALIWNCSSVRSITNFLFLHGFCLRSLFALYRGTAESLKIVLR